MQGKVWHLTKSMNIWILDCMCEFCNAQIYTLLCFMQKSKRETWGTKNGRTVI